jgi:hypothetical protein
VADPDVLEHRDFSVRPLFLAVRGHEGVRLHLVDQDFPPLAAVPPEAVMG